MNKITLIYNIVLGYLRAQWAQLVRPRLRRVAYITGYHSNGADLLVALCEDGTLWELVEVEIYEGSYLTHRAREWKKIHAIPAGNEQNS